MSNFSNLSETGEMELLPMGGSSSVAPQSIPDDFSSVEGIVMGDTWRGITRSADRVASVDSAYGRFVDQMNKDKSVMIPWQDHAGEAKQMPVYDTAGGLTKVGKEYFDQSRDFLEQAARREDGGVAPSPFNDQLEVSQDLVGLLGKQQKQFDPLHDMTPWMQERKALGGDEEAQKSMTFQDFVEFANAEVGSDEAKLDPDNKELQKEWATRMQRQLYDPSKMDSGQMMDKVAGQWVLNPNNYSEVDKMEGAIAANDDLTGSQKKMMLMDYRALVEQHAGELVNAFSAADAGVLGSIVSSPLRDEFQAAMAEPGASAYEFVKANKERFSKDSYSLGSEVGAKFRDAVMATGTGALWAASLGNYTEPAEAWGGLAEDTSKAYHNDKAFSVFGVDINRRDLTELTGQVGSFVAMGGLGALAGKGLLKAGATGASRYAGVNATGQYVLKSTVAAGATAEGAAVKTLGQKTLAGLKAAGTDPEVYIGSLQAAGMSYGKTFNENFERTGNREDAAKAANIDAISDGLSAFIATSVMNRVAPGMGKAFGMADEGVSGGIVQNIRNRMLTREGMEGVKEGLEQLAKAGGRELSKQFSKDLLQTMSLSAKQLGLKGIGVFGNAGAEAVEEASDEMISDVISSMLDDSKTWTEDVWGNIGEKWKEYVKAGVLGAIGGGMGDSIGVATPSGFAQTFLKGEGLKAQEGMWDQIKTRVTKFDSLEPFATAEVAGFKNMAEFIQAEKPVNADGTESMTDEQWVQKKSNALLAAARSGFQKDFTASVMGQAPVTPETADSTAPAVDLGSSATEAAATSPAATAAAKNGTPANPSTKFTQTMEKAKVTLPENHQWRKGVDVGVDEKAKPIDLGNNQTARVLVATSERATLPVGIEIKEPGKPQRILSPDQIRAELASNPSKEAQKILKDFENRTHENITNEFAEAVEPTVQGAAEPATKDGAKAAATGTGLEQGGSQKATASAKPAVEPLNAEAESYLAALDPAKPPGPSMKLDRLARENKIQSTGKKPGDIIEALKAQKAAHTASLSLPKESTTVAIEAPSAEGGASESLTKAKSRNTYVNPLTPSKGVVPLDKITKEKVSFGGNHPVPAITFEGGKSVPDLDMVPEDNFSLQSGDTVLLPGYDKDGQIAQINSSRPAAPSINNNEVSGDTIYQVTYQGRSLEVGSWEIGSIVSKKSPAVTDTAPQPEAKQADENQSKADAKTEAGQALEGQVPSPVGETAPAGSSAPQALSAPAQAKVVSVRNKIGDTHALNVGDVFTQAKTADHTMEKDAAGKETGLSVNAQGETWVSEELFQKLHDEHEGNANKIAQAIRARAQAVPVALDAKPIEAVAEVDDMLNQDASYVVSLDTISSGEPDSTGGVWRRYTGDGSKANEDAVFGEGEESFAYTPPNKAGLSLAVGDVVLIGGKADEALVLDNVSNGEWFFRRVKIDGSGLTLMTTKRKQASINWQTTQLMAGAVMASPLLAKIQNRSVTPAEMKALFLEMVNLVAPGYKGKIVETKFGKASASFVQADLGAGTIKVDYAKLGDTFGNLLQHANLGNTITNEALAADVARVMAKMVDEEVIHLLAAKVINAKESIKLYKDVWKAGKDVWKAGKDSPLFKMMMETAAERYPGIDPDPDYHGKDQSISDVDNAMFSVVAETLRKLHQLSTSGSTTESAVHDSFLLQAAIGRDLRDGNKAKKFINTVREMLRRYSDRIRKILWMRWQQGRLPADQQRVLAQLNADYRKAKINGDLDNAQGATEQRVTRMEAEAAESYEEWVNAIGRDNYEPLNELRQLTERFPNTQLEQLLMVTDDMRLEINPAIRALVEDYGLLDLAAVDQALAALNTDTKDVKGRDMSSYRQAMTVAFLKKQVADAKLAALDSDLAETVSGMIASGEGSLEKNHEGLGRVMRLVMDSPASPSQKATALEGLERQLKVEEERLQAQYRFISTSMVEQEVNAYDIIDEESFAGRIELMKLAQQSHEKYGVELLALSEDMSQEEVTAALRQVKESLKHKARLHGLHSQHLIPTDGVARTSEEEVGVTKEFKNLHRLQNELKAVYASMAELKQEQAALPVSDEAPQPLDPTTPSGQLIAFLNATDDYNQYLKNILHRSLGDFFVNKEDFGVVFTDISQRTGIGAAMKFPTYSDTLPEALSPSDVFGADMRQQDGIIGFHRKRHWAKDGVPLTQEQIRQNQEIEVIDRKAKSNASFAGRQHFNRAFLDYMLGRFGMKEDYDLYMDNGGFALKVTTDEETGRYRVERPQVAFQSRNLTTHNQIRNAISKLKSKRGTDRGQGAIALLTELEAVLSWARKVESTVGPKMVAEIAGRQTLAARAKLVIDDQFKNKERLRYVDKNGNFTNVEIKGETTREVNGLVPLVDSLHGQVLGILQEYLKIETNTVTGEITSFEILNGKDIENAYAKINNLLFSEVGNDVQARLSAANDTVKLVRNALKGFKDTNWRRNYEQEGSLAQRSESFMPENPELLELKHSPIDIRIVSSFLWNTRFHEKGSDYYVSNNFALDMLTSHDRINYGEGRLPELYTERKTKRFGLSDSDVAVFEATGTHPDFPEGTEMQRDLDGNPYVMVTFAEPNVSDAVTDPNGIGFDNRGKPGNMAVQGETMTAIREDLKPDSSLTRAQSLEDRAGMGTNSRRYWVSQWGLAIGSNSEGEFSGEAAKRFLFDIVRAEADGVSANDRAQLLQRGLAGLFPAVDSFPTQTKAEFFKRVQDEFLAKSPSYLARGTNDAATDIGSRFSAEQFLLDLAEYKADFERKVLVEANVGTSLGDAVNAVKLSLPSEETVEVEEEVDVEQDVPNPLFEDTTESPFDFGPAKQPKTIKQTTKQKVRKQIKKSTLRHNSFASEEESVRIQEMLESMMTQNQPPIYDASLLVGGIDGVGNAFVSMLLQNLTGKTQIVSPTEKQVVKAGLQNVGLKVFMGGDGVPNLIYAPQGQSSPELKGSAAHGVIAQLLTIAVQDEAVREEIDRLGRSIERTLDPVFLVEGLYNELADGQATWTTPGIQDKLLSQPLSQAKEQALGNQPAILRGAVNATEVMQRFGPLMKNLSPAEKRRFRKDLTTHLIKLTEHSSSLDIIKQKAGSISLFPKRTAHLFQKQGETAETVEFDERGTTSRILLVAEIMTNPVARRYFEKAYIGLDQIENTQLQPAMERSLFEALQAIARPDSEREMFDSETAENAGESATVEQGNREDDDIEVEDENTEETTLDNPELLEAQAQLDTAEKEEAAALGAIQGNDPKAVYQRNALGPQQDAVNTRLRQLTKNNYRNERVHPVLSAEDNSPSNALLFNGMARILELGKLSRNPRYSGEAPQSRVGNVLSKPPVGDRDTQLKTKPLWKAMEFRQDPQIIYVGEMQNLTIPKLGGQTAQNLAFSTRRVQRAKSALIMGSPAAYALIAELAQQHVGAKLEKDANAASFARLEARVEVTDELMAQLQAMLPSARVEEIQQEIRNEIANLEEQLNTASANEFEALAAIELLNAQTGRVQQDAQDQRRKALNYEIKAIKDELARHAKGVRFVRTDVVDGQPVKIAKDVLDQAWLDQKNEKLAELQEELEGLDSLDHGSLTAEDYENPSLRDQARERVVAHVLSHVDAIGELAVDAGNMGTVMTDNLRAAMASDPELQDHANALFRLLNDLNGKLNLFERAQETAFLAEAVDPGVIASTIARQAGVLMKAYNIRASLLNAHIEFHARNTFRLYGMDGTKLATGRMKVKRFTIDEEAPVTRQSLAKMRQGLREMTNGETMAKGFLDTLVKEVVSSVSGRSQASNETNKFIRSVAQAYLANPQMDLNAYVEERINTALDEEFADGFKQGLDEVAMTVGAAWGLVNAKVKSPGQLEDLKTAEQQLRRATTALEKTRRDLGAIDNNDGENFVGTGYHQDDIGSPAKTDRNNRVISPAVPASKRNVGVNLFLVPEGMAIQPEVGESEKDFEYRLKGVAMRWKNQSAEVRREHYIKQQAVNKALGEVVENYVDDAYRMARGTEENFIEFDPFKVIMEAVDFANAEQVALNDYFGKAASDAQQAANAGLRNRAVALLTDPQDKAGMKLLTASEKGSVKRIRLPDNHQERQERIGRLFEMDGESVVLVAQNATQRLMDAYPKEITKRNVDSSLQGMVLDALALENPSNVDELSPPIANIRSAVRKALEDSGFAFSDNFDELQASKIARLVTKRLRGAQDLSPEFIEDGSEALSYLVYEQLGLPERDQAGREKIRKAIAEWMETGKEPKSIDKSLWQKVLEIINRISSLWNGGKFQSIETLLSKELNEVELGRKNYFLTPASGRSKISFQKIVNRNPDAVGVMTYLQDQGVDFTLTGSFAYADQVAIYRDVDQPVHDVDMVLKDGNTEAALSKLAERYTTASLYDFRPRQGEAARISGIIIAPKEHQIVNVFTRWVKTKNGFEPSRSYDVINRATGEKVGSYKFSPAGEVSENAGVILDLIEHKAGVEREFVNQIFTEKSGKQRSIKVSNYVSGFIHKLELLRYKDLRDFRMAQPVNTEGPATLNALGINPNGPTNPSGSTAPSFSYFLNGILAKKTEKFGDVSFALTTGQPDITREDAAKLFHDKWLGLAQRFLNNVANQESGNKVVSLEDRVSKATVADWGNQLQMLVMAHGDRNLKKETREQIEVILTAIDSGSMVQRDTGMLGVETKGMYALNIHGVFAKAFSEIEAKAIQKRLIAGMAITGKGNEMRFWMLKYVHHQDARIRNRFIKDHAAREAAKHLNAILDYGFNLKTGRRGYETSKKAAQEEIGQAAKKVGSNALNQTLGYMMAVVRGMENAHQMTKREAVVEFARVLSTGFVQLEEFDKAQKEWYGNGLNRYWNGHNLDLVRDLELAAKVRGVLRDSAVAGAIRTMKNDTDAQVVMDKLIASLEASVEDGKLAEVKAYGDTVHKVMTDIHNAMQFTTAMLSQEADDKVTDDARQPWRDNHRASFKQTYSTVPLRLSYAVHPDPQFMGKEAEGKYITDAIDLVSFADASLFGGIGRNEVTSRTKNVYRPIDINGLTGPLGMVDDALYRLNVTPTYEVLRRSFGKVVNDHGLPTVKEGHLFNKVKEHNYDKETTPDYYDKVAEHEDEVFAFQKALAGVVSEHEVQIQNDAAINVSNTGGAEVMRFMGTNYVVRALASPMQLWDQTASPSIGYTAGKLVAGKGRMAMTYFSLVGKLLASVATDGKFYKQVRAMIERVEPAVYYRSADGQDVAKDMMGSQVRYGKDKGRNLLGKGLRKYEQLSEKALSLTIGSGERVIASAVFLTELMELLGNQNLEQVMAMEADDVPMMAKVNARTKVNDLMSQSDQGKKGWLFQTRTTSPTANALLRSAVRFSNHTAGMSSNASVLFPAAIDPLLGKLNPKKWGDVDKESQQEALENVVQTLFQNVLFYPMKLKVMVPLLLMAFFKSTGDDDDEATKKAQELANDMLAPTDDGLWFMNAFKSLVFGRERELFQSKPKKTGKAARSSALAELMTKSVLEGFQLVPGYGALAGYSPVSSALQLGLTNPLSESASALITGVPRADGMYGKKSTTIRSYEKDWDENLVSITAPTMMAHDMGKAMKLMVDYNLTRDAEKDRGMALFNSTAYLISELVPFAREFRSFMQGELKEPVYKEEKREKKRNN